MRSFIQVPDNNKDFEAQYWTYYLAADTRQTKISIAVWLVPTLLFAYGDYLIWGLGSKFSAMLSLRLAFCAFSGVTIYRLGKTATTKDYNSVFLQWAAVAIAVVIYFNYSWAPYVPPSGAVTSLVLFSTYVVFPTRFRVQIIPPLTLSAGNLILHFWLADATGPFSLLGAVTTTVMANTLGIIFSSMLQKYRRTEFTVQLEETRIKEELSRLASTDDLTGIFNRRKLLQLGNDLFAQYKAQHRLFSVLMIDIDHFKKLNDNYGHEVGDLFLVNFAAYITSNVQAKHIWGRLGGEEFVLILPDRTAEQASLIAEKLRLGLTNKPLAGPREPLAVTISIGLTEVQQRDHSFYGLLSRADEALYRAKRDGRNRTELM